MGSGGQWWAVVGSGGSVHLGDARLEHGANPNPNPNPIPIPNPNPNPNPNPSALEMRVLSTVHGPSTLSLLAIFAANCTGPLPGMKSRHSPELRSHSVPHTAHEIEWLGLPSAATRSFTFPWVIGKRQVRHEPSVT